MAGNPFDQFDPSASSAASGNPFDQFDTGAKAAPAQSKPAALGGVSDPANWVLAGLDHLGMGLGTKNPFMAMPEQFKQDVAQSHQNLGLLDYPLAAAAYAVGPGKILGPAGAAIGGSGIGGMAAEGALAGGASSAIQDPTNLSGIAGGALTGGALGAGAGVLTKGANAGLQKAFGKPGTVDPAAAIASTAKDSADAYAKLHQVPADPQAITGALKGALTDLDPSVITGMSPGLKSTILDIGQTVQNLPEANMGQINSWQRQINAAAQRERHPTDQVVAAKISSALDGVIQQGGAGDLNVAAQAAAQKNIMAENLAEWQRKAANGAPLGQAPLTEAENFYQGKPQYDTLVDLYKQSQSQQDPSWALSHLAGHALGTAGYAMGGFPGSMAGEALGVLGVKPMIKKMFKGARQNSVVKGIQAAYPQMTGVPLTGAQPGPQVGDMIKNLMLGSAF